MILFKPYGDAEQERELLRGIAEVVCVREGESGFDEALATCDVMLADVDIRVTDELLQRAKNLRAIVCRSIGVDFVDLQSARERGIMVFNSPEYCVNAVAEHAVGLMFALSRHIVCAHNALAKGDWDVREDIACFELQGKTLGIAGFGRIGHRIAEIAHGIGMNVCAYDQYDGAFADARFFFVKRAQLDELLSTADVLTLHMPVTPETRGMIGRAQFANMKKGMLLLNVARGGIVDESAFEEALQNGTLRGAGLDVFETEPPEAEKLKHWRALNVISTPHMAWNSKEAKDRNRIYFLQQIQALAKGEMASGRVC